MQMGGRIGRQAAMATVVLALAGCTEDAVGALGGSIEVPAEVDFGAVSLATQRVKSISIRNTGRGTVTIAPPGLAPPVAPDFSLVDAGSLTVPGGSTVELKVAFSPSATGDREQQLSLVSDLAGTQLAPVRLRGLGVLGQATLDSQALDFGRVPVRSSVSLVLTAANPTAWPTEILVAAPGGDDAAFFRADVAGTTTVPGGGQKSIGVSFLPARVGPYSAFIAVTPCATCAQVTVALAGEGIAAALEAEPEGIVFGFVAPGSVSRRTVRLRNGGSNSVQILSQRLGSGTGPGMRAVAATLPATLAPGSEAAFDVEFAPTGFGRQIGTLRFATDSPSEPEIVVGLAGTGGGPRLEAVPSPLQFAPVGVGVPAARTLTIRNAGHDPTDTAPLQISGWEITSGDAEFSVDPAPAGGVTLRVGDVSTLAVRFLPLVPGLRAGVLRLHSNDSAATTTDVALGGEAVDTGPCSWSVLPERVDFGSVPVGARSRLAFALQNTGTASCSFLNIRVSRGTPAQFSVASPGPQIVAPGGVLVVPVEFRPDADASFAGVAEFDTSSASAPTGSVTLVGRGSGACVRMDPPLLSFGTVGLACQAPVRTARLSNLCAQPVDYLGARLGTGTGDDFQVDAGTAPRTLAPGDSLAVDVSFQPLREGFSSAPLFVRTSALPMELTVALEGSASTRPTRTDTFTQSAVPKVDFLFVVDNSGSMYDKQDAVAQNFDRFIQEALARGVDFHVAITSTGIFPYGAGIQCPGGADGGEAGRFFPVDRSFPRILTPRTPDLAAAFDHNVRVGSCHWYEEGLDAARRALSPPLVDHPDNPETDLPDDGNAGFLREDAMLYVLFVSDADDSDGNPVADTVQALRAAKPGRPDLVMASAIVTLPGCTRESIGTRYIDLVHTMGGKIGDICSPDFGGLLQTIGTDAFQPEARFPLSATPVGATVAVTIDGNEIRATASDGSVQWVFDPTMGDHGAVVFAPGHEPGGSTTLQITYETTCTPSAGP